jgi:hypothetical protein
MYNIKKPATTAMTTEVVPTCPWLLSWIIDAIENRVKKTATAPNIGQWLRAGT